MQSVFGWNECKGWKQQFNTLLGCSFDSTNSELLPKFEMQPVQITHMFSCKFISLPSKALQLKILTNDKNFTRQKKKKKIWKKTWKMSVFHLI